MRYTVGKRDVHLDAGWKWPVYDHKEHEHAAWFNSKEEAQAAAAHMNAEECNGHPAGPFDPMGVTVYCDGSCSVQAVRT